MSVRHRSLAILFAFGIPVIFVSYKAGSLAPALGDPLPGLTAAQSAAFNDGKETFEEVESIEDGLGPVFNEASCATCHNAPVTGGGSTRTVTRFGRSVNGVFDPLDAFGGSLIQDHGIGAQGSCDFQPEAVPVEATVTAHRRTTPLFGLGLVDAVPDAVYLAIAAAERALTPDTAGHVNMVRDLVSGHDRVGKFGWKCQNPNLFQFSGDAYINEMGITNILFPNENCPNGDCTMLACNPQPGINDTHNDVQKFADFMTFLAPPPRGPVNGQVRSGEVFFIGLGCANCHLPVLKTGPNPVKALDRVTFSPYSDFLVHDMGSLGDGIQQAQAGVRELRTAPLWGVRNAATLLHDGRASTLQEAILAHDGQGKGARDRFAALNANQKAAVVAFLKSL